jgi:hypothetical protein
MGGPALILPVASERAHGIFAAVPSREDVVANKEQKRSSREAKKPKQKKQSPQKPAPSKIQITKT